MSFSPKKKKISTTNTRAWLSVGIIALCAVLVFFTLSQVAAPRKFELQVGDIAPQTITATKDVEDTINTQALIDAARAAVSPVTLRDEAVGEQAQGELERIFAATGECRTLYEQYRQRQIQLAQAMEPESALPDIEPDASLLSRLKSDLSPVSDDMTDAQLRAILVSEDAAYTSLRDSITAMVSGAYTTGVREEDVSRRISEMKVAVYNRLYAIEEPLQPFAYALITHSLKANIAYDEEATEQARLAAEEAVEPIVFKKGQNIVRQGDPIGEHQLSMLDSLGLLKDSARSDMPLYIGMGLMVLLLSLAAVLYSHQFERELLFGSPKRALLVASIVALSVLWGLGIRTINIYLMPVHFGVMMIAALLSPRMAVGFSLLLSVCAGVLATGQDGVFSTAMFEVLLMSVIGGNVAIYMLRRVQRRTTLLLAGLFVGLTNALSILAIGLLTSVNLRLTLQNAGVAAAGGLLSAVLTIGFLPLLEAIFGVMTQQKLLELSNPNQPLLRKLQIEAPGTYHHSLLVANLAEAAAEAVGANAMLARVGAYYHDIGKTKRPMFFKENQLDDVNPHDGMAPQVSAAILAAHVRDGRAMGEKAKLPVPILDVISQHHGTTTMAYFYHRAKKLAEETGEEVLEEDYRYDGPIPDNKETAIISLADTVEAAVRSLPDHSRESVQGMIRKLINGRMQDGQLANVPLTLADFNKIEEAFMLVLGGIYHTRVEYPELKKPQSAENK